LQRVEVAFCGESVYLAGLAAGLRQNAELRIVQVDKAPYESISDLKLICPDVIVAEEVDPETIRALLREDIRALVIAVEAATDSFTVMAGRELMTSAVTELAPVIAGYDAGKAGNMVTTRRKKHDQQND